MQGWVSRSWQEGTALRTTGVISSRVQKIARVVTQLFDDRSHSLPAGGEDSSGRRRHALW